MVVQSLTHPVQLLEMLNNQRMQALFTDINVIVSGQQFSVHRCFLAAHSNVLCTVLQDSTNQGVMNLNLDILDPDCFSVILDFMYSSKLNVTKDNVHQIKEIAICLQINTIVDLCEQFIASHYLKTEQESLLVDETSHESTQSQYLKEPDQNNSPEVEESSSSNVSMEDTPKIKQSQRNPISHMHNHDTDVCESKKMPNEKSNENSFTFEVRNTEPPTKIFIESHLKRGRKPEKYKCEICSKSFIKSAYKIHMRTHTGAKENACKHCKKQFASIYNLQIHMRQHTGEKPYSCDICLKSFADPSSHRKHQLWHADIRNHECCVCSKKFLAKAALKTHMATHTLERRYVCQECGKSYRNRCDLNSHNREHTGELFGPCYICGKKFNHKGNYVQHLRKHLPDKPSTSARINGFSKIKSQPQDALTDVLRELAAAQIPVVTTQVEDGQQQHNDQQHNDQEHNDQETIKFASLQNFADFVSSGEVEISITDGKLLMKSSLENVQMENNIDVNNLLNTADMSLHPAWDIAVGTTTERDVILPHDSSSVLLKDSLALNSDANNHV